MRTPKFLSVSNVIDLHTSTISHEGGGPGIRDLALLESAVMLPQQQFGGRWLHPDLPTMAAAYLFHIAGNHPFVDGNKRAAAMAAFVFLDVNGYDLIATPEGFESVVLQVASGLLTKEELVVWMRGNIRLQP